MPSTPVPTEPGPCEPLSEERVGRHLGSSIRRLRREQGLTLVQLAERAQLSHSFLSQLERGRARPSMPSLHRIAQALGTTQPALMSVRQRDDVSRTSFVPAGEGVPVDNLGGVARSLVVGARSLYPMLFDGASTEFGPAYTHGGDEFIHVIAGSIEIEVESEGTFVLREGDSLFYSGGLAHRWRALGRKKVRTLFVQEAGHGQH